jgi:hypothetical protein
VGLQGAVVVPLYVEDPSNGPASLMKKMATIGTGGWWLGGTHMIPNNDFLAQARLHCLTLLNLLSCPASCQSAASCVSWFMPSGNTGKQWDDSFWPDDCVELGHSLAAGGCGSQRGTETRSLPIASHASQQTCFKQPCHQCCVQPWKQSCAVGCAAVGCCVPDRSKVKSQRTRG